MEIRIKLSEKFLDEKAQEVMDAKEDSKSEIIEDIGNLLALTFFRQESGLHEYVEVDCEKLDGEAAKKALKEILLDLCVITIDAIKTRE